VWFPPGEWLPYLGGPTVHGPDFHEVALPLEQTPLWVRAGRAVLLADQAGGSATAATSA
jgi:alpha-D-xyloside xylohydrolase